MATISDKFRITKKDITPYLFHFVNGHDDYPNDTLKKIMNEKQLVSKNDYISFTASPVTSLDVFFRTKASKTGRPLYQPYGIGFSRDILIRDYGARNLIYFSDDEFPNIPHELKWRSDRLNIEKYDFEWLREWRIHGNTFNFAEFPIEHIIVITPTANELLNIIVSEEPEIFVSGNPITGDIDYYVEETYKRKWKGYTLKQINMHDDDVSLSDSTNTQIIGKDMINDIKNTIDIEHR